MMRLPTLIQPRGGEQQNLRQMLVPDRGVEIGRDDLNDDEHADRQRREDHRRSAAFGRQRADFAPHLETLPDDAGQVVQDFAEIAAGGALDGDGGDEQRQIVGADAAVKIAHRRLEIGAIGDFVGHDAEFTADRIGHFASDHGDGDRHRMAGAQAAHDDIERIGELGAEFLLPPRAQHAQHEVRQHSRAEQSRQRRLDKTAARTPWSPTNARPLTMATMMTRRAKPDGEARLQDQPVERDQIEPVIAAAGQPAFAPQFDQHAFAIGPVLRQHQPPVDLAAIGCRRKAVR